MILSSWCSWDIQVFLGPQKIDNPMISPTDSLGSVFFLPVKWGGRRLRSSPLDHFAAKTGGNPSICVLKDGLLKKNNNFFFLRRKKPGLPGHSETWHVHNFEYFGAFFAGAKLQKVGRGTFRTCCRGGLGWVCFYQIFRHGDFNDSTWT